MHAPRPSSPGSVIVPVAAAAFAAVVLLGGCRPAPTALQYCNDAPCAAGLECVDGVCLPILPMPEPPPPCTSNEECAVDNNSDGRECVDGQCQWVECAIDVQCGTRICDQGVCAPRTLCVTDGDCKDGGICVDGTCRSPCEADEECPQGILPQTCLEGRCEQTCVVDLLCFGGICEDGLCVEAECDVDGDCPMPNMACTDGRCEGYTPCGDDEDCFDPDFLCNDLGRCEARPSCVIDAECGAASLCIADVCRPATPCADAADCSGTEECIAGRCVEAAGCRQDAECTGTQLCVGGACADVEPETPSAVVVETAHGPCRSDGTGPCELVLFAGETAVVEVGAFDTAFRPIHAPVSASSSSAAGNVTAVGAQVFVTAVNPGQTTLQLDDAGGARVHESLSVRVVSGVGGEPLRVLVVDGATGGPAVGATVVAGDLAGTSDADGLVVFGAAPGPDALGVEGLTVSAVGRTGVVVLGLTLAGNLRVVLPAADPSPDQAAGVSGQVLSSGDEIGPVGYGIGLVGQASLHDATLRGLFGPAYVGSLEAPLIGAVEVALPAAVTLEATVPLVMGAQVVRDRYYAITRPGLRTVTGFELRREVGDLLGSVFGAADLDLALNLATDAEGMDVLVAPAGEVAAADLITDGDDVDGDGDVTERVPPWTALPAVDVVPMRKPRERVGLVVGNPPSQARARLFVVGGLLPAGLGFVPTGMATLGSGGGVQQLRVAPPEAGYTASRRAVRVEAVFDDDTRDSALLFEGAAFGADLELGSFLVPPEGSFVLDDVPVAGGHMLVLASSPGATTYVAELVSPEGRLVVLVPSTGAGGRSVPLPATITGGVGTLQVTALRRDGVNNDAATASLVAAGDGPVGDLRDGARAVATVREVGPAPGP